jgi:hypothetical protein
MGAKRVTPEEIVEMHRLYKKLSNYAAVGKEIGRSGSTVSRYVQMRNIPKNIRVIVEEKLKVDNSIGK